ncbi:MAG: phenylalanine--tRNA ligase subunit beta [Gammaproteobacteria bacterium]|nr:phenylalanine--tRNA ligase subunit beta [Gammaproteobacteria bacterium]
MIFSNSWLKEWVDHQMCDEDLMESLTMAGLEVDGSAAVARQFSEIVVAEVQLVEQHPDADKLSVCSVNDGEKVFQVVCGATNVKQGMKVPFAKIGAEILVPDEDKPFRIKAAKLKGVESQGMICSAEEMGLEEKSEGILELSPEATLGEDIRGTLDLDDLSIELDLTPNRGDCLGMVGLAREVGVLTRKNVNDPGQVSVAASCKDEFPISITAKDGCPRYLGRVIKNINLNSSSPLWMQEKLRRSGIRSIDPIVDVTNFVLMELGQPMHAFDYERLHGGIDVRMAAEGEKLTLLDGKEVELNPNILVIADHAKAVAMAGIMGGLDTAVSDSTKNVFLECAYFDPLTIAGRARAFGMHTDASHRYERGVDYQLQQRAMERATELLLEIVGGEAGPITEAIGNLPTAAQVKLNYQSVPDLLGIEMERSEIREILERLGFTVLEDSDDYLALEIPPYRFDISIEADLIEELARIYGYNNIPETLGMGQQVLETAPEAELPVRRIRQQLATLGYQEVVTYSFIDPALSKLVMGSEFKAIPLQNPISEDLSVMRGSLLPGLLSTYHYNANRQQSRQRLFETGLVFQQEGHDIHQRAMLGGLISGNRLPEIWSNNRGISDFYDIKGDVETILSLQGQNSGICFEIAEKPGFHPGQCAKILHGQGTEIGYLGALHPAIARELDVDATVYLFELSLDEVQKGEIPKAKALSKYPEVSRDMAIVIAENITSGEILSNVQENAGEFLVGSRIFDVYQGDAVTKGKKSIALGLTWQHPSRTLSDDEINTIISRCVNALEEQFNANLRS